VQRVEYVVGCATLQSSSSGDSNRPNVEKLHAAAECIRRHGIPAYADPVVAPDGTVYSDQRSLEAAQPSSRGGVGNKSAVPQAITACRTEIAAANFHPAQRPHPTAQMLRDGVKEAECFRANGLPHWPDPKATDTFDPGHGFQVSGGAFAGAVPPGSNPKASAVFQHAAQACQAEIEAPTRDSSLSSLATGDERVAAGRWRGPPTPHDAEGARRFVTAVVAG